MNSKGVLADATVIRVAPDAKKIIIMPVSAFTVSGSQTMREIHEEGGMVKLEAAVADTFGITIDNYVSLTNDAFENAADIVGGITYTPDEELYYLSQDNDENDIAIPSGDLTNLSGHQIRLICQYPVFKEGRNGNMKFLGTAVTMLINNAFQQTNITKDNLDNFYNIFTANSDTDWTSAQYKEESHISRICWIRTLLLQKLLCQRASGRTILTLRCLISSRRAFRQCSKILHRQQRRSKNVKAEILTGGDIT